MNIEQLGGLLERLFFKGPSAIHTGLMLNKTTKFYMFRDVRSFFFFDLANLNLQRSIKLLSCCCDSVRPNLIFDM